MKKRTEELPRSPAFETVLRMLRAALRSESLPALAEGVSWREIFGTARAHRVENILFGLVKSRLQQEDPEVFRQWERVYQQNQVQVLTQEAECQEILELFRQADIPVVVMKGIQMRQYYPRPDWRLMADLDLFVGPQKKEEAGNILLARGYTLEDAPPNHYHDGYQKPPYLHVEIHNQLMRSYDRQLPFFKDPWPVSEPVEGSPGMFRLNPTAFYIFMIAHASRHYFTPDCDIRRILDLYLYRKACGTLLNQAVIDRELGKIHLTRLGRQAEQLAEWWFGRETLQPLPPELEEFGWTICFPSLCGDYEAKRMLRLSQSGQSKFVFLVRRALPGLEEMEGFYPVLHRWPVLLPFCWVYRLIFTFLTKRKKILGELKWLKNQDTHPSDS